MNMLALREPLDCRVNYSEVLDLRTTNKDDAPLSPKSWTTNDSYNSTPRYWREMSLTPPATSLSPPNDEVSSNNVNVSPTSLSFAQKVINAATGHVNTRPFKIYPKDILSLPTSEDYLQFRDKMLSQMGRNGAIINNNNDDNDINRKNFKKRSASPQQHPTSTDTTDDKTAAYWEKRRKNNEAAKRSRDARRAKEDEIAIRAAFLEQENVRLKYQLAVLSEETTKLRCILYNSNTV